MGAGRNAATTLETLSQSLVECLQCPIYGSEGVLGVERKTLDKFIPSRILLSHYGLALLALLLKKSTWRGKQDSQCWNFWVTAWGIGIGRVTSLRLPKSDKTDICSNRQMKRAVRMDVLVEVTALIAEGHGKWCWEHELVFPHAWCQDVHISWLPDFLHWSPG